MCDYTMVELSKGESIGAAICRLVDFTSEREPEMINVAATQRNELKGTRVTRYGGGASAN